MDGEQVRTQSMELVVSRWSEDLRWLRRVPLSIHVTIYNKGEELDPELIALLSDRCKISFLGLENIGREAHSYLTHLITRYDNLPALMVFCQGHPFDHAPDFHDRLRALDSEEESIDRFRWYGFLDETDDPQGKRLFVPWSKNPERLLSLIHI